MSDFLNYSGVVCAVIGLVYLFLFCVSMIIPSMQKNWKKYLFRALLFIGIFFLETVILIQLGLPML